jgi:predicted ester cyclase
MVASANEALVRRAIEAIWNDGDLDVADELFADEYVNHHGVIADLVRGPEAIKISAALHRLAFPDLHIVIEELSTNKQTVVLRWTAIARSTGRARGIAASSQSSLSGITHSRFAGGRIVESWTEWDGIGLLSDLGFVPTQ